MSISSQLPPISLAQASASLRALAQAGRQTVEARVIAQSPNGTTQVQIGRQVLSLTLPDSQPIGTTLTLSVQTSDGQLRLGLVSARPPSLTNPPAVPAGAGAAPAASVQLSAAALASNGAPAASKPAGPPPGGSGAIPPAGAPTPAAAAPAGQIPYSGYAASSAPAPLSPATASVAAPAPPAVAPGGIQTSPERVQAPSATTQTPAASSPSATAGAGAGAGVSSVSSPSVNGPVSSPSGQVAPAVSAGQQPGGLPAAAVAAPAAGVQAAAPAARPGIPYAVAAPITAAPQVTSVAGSAVVGLPPIAQMGAGGLAGQHASSTQTQQPSGQVATGMVAPPGSAAVAQGTTSPQAALAQMVQQALPRQDSILGLTTALTAVVAKVALPEPVMKAAQQVLATRLSFDGGKVEPAALRTAVQQSGVFQEALLASGLGQAAASDAKSALLALRQSLGAWLGNQTPVAQLSAVAPPLRGHVPRARAGEGQIPSLPEDPAEAGKVLLERTEAALSRLRLHQNASLPDPAGQRQEAQWSMDLPVIVAGQQQVLHLQIQRDAEQEVEQGGERSWQVRFAINLAERGEVGAQISLRAKNTGILIWADDPQTAQSLAAAVDTLREEIGQVGLVPGAVVVRAGAPASPATQPGGTEGHVVDARR